MYERQVIVDNKDPKYRNRVAGIKRCSAESKLSAPNGFKPRFTITNAIISDLTLIERARGFLEAATLSEDWVRAMGARALLLEAHHTTHIEGTRLTIDQAEQLLAGKPVPEADPDDVQELLNYRRAFEFVTEYLKGGEVISEGLIREIHKQLAAGVRGGSAAPGEYRKVQNYVVNSATGDIVYTPPPAQDVPILMAELVAWMKHSGDIHPVLTSGIAQYQLVHIHPFLDGNGRTSRLLSTICLYRAGYDFKRLFSVSEYYDRDRTTFYQTIESVRERGMDLTGWLEFFVVGLSSQLGEVRRRSERAIQCDILVREHNLSGRQAKALNHALEFGALTIQEYGNLCPGANRRTLQRDLRSLIEKGLLIELGTSPTDPTKRYTIPESVLRRPL